MALPGAHGAPPATNSAHEITFWTRADRVASLTDVQLDAFADMGVGGFVMQAQFLTDGWTDDPDANLKAGKYALQREIRDSRIVQRATARGIDLYLGFFATNAANDSTPYADWFDDEGWVRTAEKMGGLAGAARMLGFRGIAIDQELYNGARWTWNYQGNTHTEAAVRAKAKQRGREAMTAILEGFPGVEIAIYNFMQKDSWLEWVYEDDRHPSPFRRPEHRPLRTARGHRLLGRDDVGRGLLGDPPMELRVRQELALGERPREQAQMGERDASRRVEYR